MVEPLPDNVHHRRTGATLYAMVQRSLIRNRARQGGAISGRNTFQLPKSEPLNLLAT